MQSHWDAGARCDAFSGAILPYCHGILDSTAPLAAAAAATPGEQGLCAGKCDWGAVMVFEGGGEGFQRGMQLN